MKIILPLIAILLFAAGAYGQAGNSNVMGVGPGPVIAPKALKVLKKPHARPGNCAASKGVARLKVTFDRSATVTNAVLVIPSGCPSFDERAIEAARRIKFEPAERDGQPITVLKTVEYKYTRY